ncbi:hypothetical protein CBR_g12572 [Chara braunii]|uniref:ACT domain-containing protein n=1 Tax=Chara braunii TaxID=69332 RepID=A0A388KS61_CHABU|nr:hypothetical protein CBR_g12572 [Chara braunii]|eukprot:GBG72852.1 hypothetical protein CBR_g12572 [Chara braunii]
MGLLLEVTRNFAINGLTVTHGHLSVMHGEASAYFYVADASGGAPNPRLLEQVIEAVKPTSLRIAPEPSPRRAATSTVTEGYAGPFSLNALQERGKVWLCSLAGGIFGERKRVGC